MRRRSSSKIEKINVARVYVASLVGELFALYRESASADEAIVVGNVETAERRI